MILDPKAYSYNALGKNTAPKRRYTRVSRGATYGGPRPAVRPAQPDPRVAQPSTRTPKHKEFLEIAPWIVVLFEERYEVRPDGEQRKNYYVKESCGIAAGLFVAALHNMGLVTLTHTPSPMAFLTRVLGRPENERPFVMFPIGYPLPGVKVPDFDRKALDEVMVMVDEPAD
jgi:iodotyrosine deiodinase